MKLKYIKAKFKKIEPKNDNYKYKTQKYVEIMSFKNIKL